MKLGMLALVPFTFAGCFLVVPGGPRSVVPPDDPSMPCGRGDDQVCPDNGCCSHDEFCGGTPGCSPVGMCCYEGPNPWALDRRDGGLEDVRMRPERYR